MLLPYLDLKKESELTKYAWAGLCYTQINVPLFTEIRRYIKYAVEHLDGTTSIYERSIFKMA